jgi:hypothetical protein
MLFVVDVVCRVSHVSIVRVCGRGILFVANVLLLSMMSLILVIMVRGILSLPLEALQIHSRISHLYLTQFTIINKQLSIIQYTQSPFPMIKQQRRFPNPTIRTQHRFRAIVWRRLRLINRSSSSEHHQMCQCARIAILTPSCTSLHTNCFQVFILYC